jgi:hypothetical protein
VIRRLTSPAVRVVAFLAAVLWVWSVSAAQVHGLLVEHAVCDEHGQTVEVHRPDHPVADEAPDERPTWSAAPAHDEHDHGCAVASVAPDEAPRVVALRPFTRLSWTTVDPLAVAEAPRGPPLDFAPKTSPPVPA